MTTVDMPQGNDFGASASDTNHAHAMIADATLHDTQVVGEVASWLERFEGIYQESKGDVSRVPWAHRQACPSMEAWLNAEAPSLIRPGARAAVVGCGFGEDACALLARGYDVVAFDACPSAIAWAKKLHPQAADSFVVSDLLSVPGRMRGRFDLVIEVHTLQSLPPSCRHELAAGMVSLLSHRGVLVAVARGRADAIPLEEVEGPPFAFTASELEGLMRDVGLAPVHPVDDFMDDNSPAVRRLRGVFSAA